MLTKKNLPTFCFGFLCLFVFSRPPPPGSTGSRTKQQPHRISINDVQPVEGGYPKTNKSRVCNTKAFAVIGTLLKRGKTQQKNKRDTHSSNPQSLLVGVSPPILQNIEIIYIYIVVNS